MWYLRALYIYMYIYVIVAVLDPDCCATGLATRPKLNDAQYQKTKPNKPRFSSMLLNAKFSGESPFAHIPKIMGNTAKLEDY